MGPWLLNQDDFESLDKVISQINSLLNQSWLNQIEVEIQKENKNASEEEIAELIEERKIRTWGNQHVIKCELTSKDETKLNDETIFGLLKDKGLNQFNPNSFSVDIVHGSSNENNFSLKVSNFHRGQLQYDINCYDSSIKDHIQFEIDKWIDKRRPNKALQIWSNYGSFITFNFIILILWLAFFSFSTSYSTYQESLNSEMIELSKAGINETNRDIALELILKSKSGYVPADFERIEKPNNPLWIRLFAVAVFIWIASIFRPKTIIGLGKQKWKLYLYNFWIKLVLITLPAVLILAPFWKSIAQWLYQ